MARNTKTTQRNISAEVAEQALADYSKAESLANELTAKMELRITKVRQDFHKSLTDLQATIDENMGVLHIYATENAGLFKDSKTHEMLHGEIGFRTGTPKLKLLKGIKWNDVTEALKKWLPKYVRKVEEPDKAALLSDRNDKEVNKKFEKCGFEVDQDEKFFVNTKNEKEVTA